MYIVNNKNIKAMSRFIEFKTISGETILVRSNRSKRHFTIKTSGGTFRTYPMSVEEFEGNEFNTGNDWACFLRSNNYFKLR